MTGVLVGVAVNVVVDVGVGDGGIEHTESSKQLPKDSSVEQINALAFPP